MKYYNNNKGWEREAMKKNLSVAFSLNAKLNFKVIVVGNKNSGKTSMIVRFVKDQFDINYKVIVDIKMKVLVSNKQPGNS